MSLRTTINLTQKQTLAITPRLLQAIEMLQMPRLELVQHIAQLMEANPAFELEENYEELEDVLDENGIEENEAAAADDEIAEEDIDLETGLPETETAAELDTPELDPTDDEFGDDNWEQYFPDSYTPNNEWEAPLDEDSRDTLANPGESLEEHLLWQLRMSAISEEDCTIGEAIIGNVDDDGYLTAQTEDGEIVPFDLEEIAAMLECDVADVERVQKLIQNFEPVGSCSRNLEECLLVQLEQLGMLDTVAGQIVSGGYLRDLAANHVPLIARKLGVSMELVQESADEIKCLETKPGRKFSQVKTEYVTPEVTVDEIDGEYRVFVSDYGRPLTLSPIYLSMIKKQGSLPDEARDYLKSHIQSARWIIESVEHRRKTILRVTESIFEDQKDFLDKGSASLKPLTRRDIAEKLDIHESTVSRATSGRYVQTPRGVFPLGYFFSSGISTESGVEASSESVREIIKEMIDKEDPQNPLSDKDILTRLNQKGFKIKLRTINKYRNSLKIPNSSRRKKY